MKIFQLGEGYTFSKEVFPQESINYGSEGGTSFRKIVFNPTFVTTKIFNLIKNSDKKAHIFGRKGIGKSISILLLWHLCSVITEFRVKEDILTIEKYVSIDKLKSIPKIIYHCVEEG